MLSLENAKKDMKRRLLRRMPGVGSFPTSLANVFTHRRDEAENPRNCLYKPMLVYMAQGRKTTVQGSRRISFGENELLIVAIDLPGTSNIVEASPDKPGLALSIGLDMNLIGQLSLSLPYPPPPDADPSPALMLQSVDAETLDTLLRLETVLDRPEETPVLGPLILRELHFRLILGPNGGHLRALHSYGTQKGHVAQAVSWLRNNFAQPFRVEDLAERVHMSASTFHRRFKEITSLSPVQFQKRLRLHEAQQLMVAEDLGISEVCERVGYENIAQFTREYKRLFGEPPRRDVMRWKQTRPPALSFAMAEG